MQLIETTRMELRGFTPLNMKEIFETYPKERIMQTLGHRSEEEYQSEAEKQKNGYASYNRSFVLFLLVEKTTGEIIGRCGLHNWNDKHFRAEIGYVMHNEDYRKKGLMTEAVQAIIQYGFEVMRLNRIEALVGANNTASLAIMKKFGFAREGLLCQHAYNGNDFEDSVAFALLKEGYNSY